MANTMTHPLTIPDLESGIIICQKDFVGEHPRSFEASIHDLSIFPKMAYIGKIMNGR
jgi:hypothetical protein